MLSASIPLEHIPTYNSILFSSLMKMPYEVRNTYDNLFSTYASWKDDWEFAPLIEFVPLNNNVFDQADKMTFIEPSIEPSDAWHLAVALDAGADYLVTADEPFFRAVNTIGDVIRSGNHHFGKYIGAIEGVKTKKFLDLIKKIETANNKSINSTP